MLDRLISRWLDYLLQSNVFEGNKYFLFGVCCTLLNITHMKMHFCFSKENKKRQIKSTREAKLLCIRVPSLVRLVSNFHKGNQIIINIVLNCYFNLVHLFKLPGTKSFAVNGGERFPLTQISWVIITSMAVTKKPGCVELALEITHYSIIVRYYYPCSLGRCNSPNLKSTTVCDSTAIHSSLQYPSVELYSTEQNAKG